MNIYYQILDYSFNKTICKCINSLLYVLSCDIPHNCHTIAISGKKKEYLGKDIVLIYI